MLKYYITFLFRQFTKTLNRFCFTYVGQTKTWKLACQFDLRNSKVKSTFEVLSLDNILIKWHYLKNVRYQVWWKLLGVAAQFLLDCYLQWNGYSEKFTLNSCTFSKLVPVGEILWRFGMILLVWLIHFLFH